MSPQFIFAFILLVVSASSKTHHLKGNYYAETCPSAESVIRKVVSKAVTENPGLGAGLIRLQFHDCFVRGCDASILLDSTPANQTEKDNIINKGSLRGYEVIDEAKEALEEICPRKVSCADIIAFAARDASHILGGINFSVKGGRSDGLVSVWFEPFIFLPRPSSILSNLVNMFAVKGLSIKEMVVLSGAHSIGVSHCNNVVERLYLRNGTRRIDPSLDRSFANALYRICPPGNTTNPTLPLDFVSPQKLDNEYYMNVGRHRVLFNSDQVLSESWPSAKLVKRYASHGHEWKKKFAKAMVKMGEIGAAANQGEIRVNCRVINKKSR